VHIDDPNSAFSAADPAPSRLRHLRLVALADSVTPQRRRLPRRRTLAEVLLERRHADRRQAKPGIDGLLRRVLADDWS
jgi:hypothetical protein